MSDAWDWDAQRADTEGTVAWLMTEKGVPEGASITLDIQTVAGPDAGPLAKAVYVAALERAGLSFDVTNEDDIETIQITVEGLSFDAEAIWTVERAVSEIALASGWQPEGWGFWEPDA